MSHVNENVFGSCQNFPSWMSAATGRLY